MKGLLNVTSVQMVDGFLPRFHKDYRDQPIKKIPKSLKITGEIEGIGKVMLYSNSALLTITYYPHMECVNMDENSWIELVKNNDDVNLSNEILNKPKYAKFNYELIPKVKVGDSINISFSIKNENGNLNITIINRVRIIKQK